MRALVKTGPQTDAVAGDVPEPRPGPGEVTIRVEVAGVNFADVLALRGDHGYSSDGPHVPGLEVVGEIQELGPGVSGLRRGQRVTAYTAAGGFAEVAVAQAGLLVPLPGDVPSSAAAAVPVTLSTAHLLVEDVARVRAADRLLAHSAAGAMGLALAALASRLPSVALIGTVGSPDKVAHALAGGYDHVVVRGHDLVSEVRAATGGRGATIILGALGTDGLGDDVQMVAPTGRIVRFGNAPGSPHAALPSLAELNAANVSIAGFSRRALARQDPSRVLAAFQAMVDALACGDVSLPVSEVDGLEALPGLLDDMARGLTSGKSVVRIDR